MWPEGDSLIREQYRELHLGLREIGPTLSTSRMLLLQSDVGSLWMHKDDQVMTRAVACYGVWEAETARWLREALHVGGVMLDIGANIGYDTIVCARAVGPSGHIIALEPDRENYALLCANLWDSRIAQVYPLCVAAAHTTGTTILSLSDDNRGDHRTFYSSQTRTEMVVPCVWVDDLLQRDAWVDVVKIDTQGANHRVVEGIQALLARSRPLMHIEFWPDGIVEGGDDPLAVLAFYRGLGYTFSLLEEPSVRSNTHNDEACVAAARACYGGYCSLIFAP